jgi:hypothetical protein
MFKTSASKSRAYWDVTPCTVVEVYRRFGGTYCLIHRSDGVWNCVQLNIVRDYWACLSSVYS